MSHFLNDVRLVSVSVDEEIVKTPSPSPSRSQEYDGSNYKGYSVHVNKHSDDGVPFAAIPITAIVFTFIYLIIKAIMAPFTHRNRQAPIVQGGGLSEEEVAILHKLTRTLSQMESRVEALETILIDQTRTEKHYGSKL